jgi:hypothetical protein
MPRNSLEAGPVGFGFGTVPTLLLDFDVGKKIFRCCNCCGNTLEKTKHFSYSGVRHDYSFTCKSCCNFILLFSREWDQDYRARDKRSRISAERRKEIELANALRLERKNKKSDREIEISKLLDGLPRLTVWRHEAQTI